MFKLENFQNFREGLRKPDEEEEKVKNEIKEDDTFDKTERDVMIQLR